MKHVKFLALSLSIATLLAAPTAFAQTATTDPVGFSTADVPSGSSIVVPTLLKPAVFTGNAVVAATTFTPTANPNWSVNAFQPTTFVPTTYLKNYPTHYVEVVEGAFEGEIFDIVSNSSTAASVAVSEIPPALIGATVKIVVRPHVTLDTIITGASGLSDYADSCNIFNQDGSTSTRLFDGASWLAEDTSSAAGHTVIYPGSGIVFSASGSNAKLVLLGSVKMTKTAIPLYPGVVNVVGPLNPGVSSQLYSANLTTGLEDYADSFNNFSTNGSLSIIGTYISDGTTLLNSGGQPLTPSSTDNIPGNRGIVVSVGAAKTWISIPPTVAP